MSVKGASLKTKILVLAVAVLGSILLVVPEAKACSCMQGDARDQLHASDGAFVGTYVGREPADAADPFGEYDYIFETEKVYKGDIGATVEVRAPENGAGCGLEYPEGARGALFAYLEEGVWRSDLCRTLPPKLLEEVSQPFPDPNAEGSPRFLVGGSFGEVRVLAVDARGRTAGYGYGEGDALHMSLCPGGGRSIEMVGDYGRDQERFVDVRRIRDLKVTSTTTAPAHWAADYAFPLGAACTNRAGDAVVLSRGYADDAHYTEVTRFVDGKTDVVHRGTAGEGAVTKKKVFLAEGRVLRVVDLATEEVRVLRRFDRRISHVTVSPDGSRLAGILGARSSDGEMVVMRSRDGKGTALRGLDGETRFALLTWLSDNALMLAGLDRNAPVYDRSLRLLSHVTDWFPMSSVAQSCKLFGVGYGALAKTSLCGGGTPEIRRTYFSPVTNSLVALPRGTEVEAPPHS